jgi:hydroxymethylbilane synthase
MRARPDLTHAELQAATCRRVERLRSGDYDAIILAAAGLARPQPLGHVTESPPEQFPPAVSQGVIGVCARTADGPTCAGSCRWMTARRASPHRRAPKRLEGGCQVPLGALATVTDRMLRLSASVCAGWQRASHRPGDRARLGVGCGGAR